MSFKTRFQYRQSFSIVISAWGFGLGERKSFCMRPGALASMSTPLRQPNRRNTNTINVERTRTSQSFTVCKWNVVLYHYPLRKSYRPCVHASFFVCVCKITIRIQWKILGGYRVSVFQLFAAVKLPRRISYRYAHIESYKARKTHNCKPIRLQAL